MSKLRLAHGVWIAVCDGRKALILENQGDHVFPKFETRGVFEQKNPPDHLQGSDRPGRIFSSAGVRRAAADEPDFHMRAEEAFLRNFAKALDQQARDNKMAGLILVAPARALGILREALSHATREMLTGELTRDYVKLPLHKIEERLAQAG